MPRRFERHARAKSDWGFPGARSAESAAVIAEQRQPPVIPLGRRPPARKDTRNWCKGKPGREHVPEMALFRAFPRGPQCRWGSDWRHNGEVNWRCGHRERCARCGKVLREIWQIPAGECPAYPGTPEQRQAAEAEARDVAERVASRRRRPPVTGPQGYRRRRAG